MKYFIFFCNLFLSIINILLLFENKNPFIIIKIYLTFKNSDYCFINVFFKGFNEISYYLKKGDILKINKTVKKKISILCCDLYNPIIQTKWLLNRLENKFIIFFNKNNPDYLIYNIFGKQHLNPKYDNAIKIAICSENKVIDLYEADYILGFAHINYLDRYCRYPTYPLNLINYNYIRKNVLKKPKRRKFCAAVISNSHNKHNFRIKFINELSKYKIVDMGGKYKNNVGGRVKDKIEFLSSYKFSIAMENSEGNGYTSEKIFNSFFAGTIPIYYGNYMIDDIINPKSYILIRNEKDMKQKIEYIKKIDNDDNLYKTILREDIIIDKNYKKLINDQKEFLLNIFEQDKSKAFRRHN